MASEKSGIPNDIPPQPVNNPPPYTANAQPTTAHPTTAHPMTAQPRSAPGVVYTSPSGPIVIQAVPVFGAEPSTFVCPSCHETIVTRTEKKVTTKTHLFALGMCAVGLWCCVCLPYFMDSCHSIDHYCPHCNAYIGSSRN